MPNKCTKCGKLHGEDADYLLQRGCECGSRFFFFFRQEALKAVEKDIEQLTPEDVEEIEKDIREIVSKEISGEETVILDLESIRVTGPGKYMIDVTNLFTQSPIVIRLGPGKYKLDLSILMKRLKKKPEPKKHRPWN